MIARSGPGRGIAYTLSEEVRRVLGRGTPEVRMAPPPSAEAAPDLPAHPPRAPRAAPDPTDPTPAEVRAIALTLARERGRVRNRELRDACGLTTQQAWRVLRRLVQEGHLVKRGTGTRDAAYEPR